MKLANIAVDGSGKYGGRLCDWLRRRRPDIVTLQKIGSTFPTKEDLRAIGYESEVLGGRWPHLGVAVLSYLDLPPPRLLHSRLPGAERDGPRFLTVDIGGLWVSSAYAPYGADPQGREEGKPRHEVAIERRVAWLNRLRDHLRDEDYRNRDVVLCGDFNVKVAADGPIEPGDSYYSDREREALEDLGFFDLYRHAHPAPRDMPGRTRGYGEDHPEGSSRLHLILASETVKRRLRSTYVDVDSRPWPRTDAPPLVVELDNLPPGRAAQKQKIEAHPGFPASIT